MLCSRPFGVSKNRSLRTVPQHGVAIPEVLRVVFGAFSIKTMGIPTPLKQAGSE